jgi:hypothetical protein
VYGTASKPASRKNSRVASRSWSGFWSSTRLVEVMAVGLRDKMRRLEDATRGKLDSFELADGSRFYYDPTSPEMYMHPCDCLMAHDNPERPEPPELVKALARAKDRHAAFYRVFDGWNAELFPYDVEALLERGEIVPISLVVGYELGEPLPDLSE